MSKLTTAQLMGELRRRHRAEIAELKKKRADVTKEMEALDAQIEHLQGVAAAPAKKRKARRAKTAKAAPKRRVRRSGASLRRLEGRVLRTLQAAKAPMGVAQIASAVRTSKNALTVPLRNLVASGKVTKKGERRQTVYSAE